MWLWLSFADPHQPRGKQFLGVAIVEVEDRGSPRHMLSQAIVNTHGMGINPGGAIQSEPVDITTIPEDCRNRLLSRNELIERQIGYSTRV